jgi:hypothetical protein
MTAPARLRASVLSLTIVSFAMGWACGRSDFDMPVDPVVPLGVGGGGGTSTGAGGLFPGSGGLGFGGSFIGGVGGEGPQPPIRCGSSVCTAPAQACCAQQGGSQMCVSAADPNACVMGIKVGCVNAASCGGGQVCCATTRPPISSSCASPVACAAGGNVAICASNAECATSTGLCCPIISPTLGVCWPSGFPCPVPAGLPP